jgi:SAM-dependent methyltransferase
MGGPHGGEPYDPQRFWDAKAIRSGGDALRAACHDDPGSNRVIDRVQRRAVAWGFRRLPPDLSARGARLLDFGCGPGRWVDVFTGYGFSYSGVDFSTEMLRLARTLHPAANFAAMVGGRIPHPDAAFDLVCSIAVIHHNSYQRQEEVLTEISRVVRPGGFAILFEGLGPRTTSGIFFPRPVTEWISALAERGFHLRDLRGYRYWILRSFVLALARHAPAGRSRPREHAAARPAWRRLTDRVDETLAPRFSSMLPARNQNRGLFVLERVAGKPLRPG